MPDFAVPRPAGAATGPTAGPTPTPGPTPEPLLPPEQEPEDAEGETVLQDAPPGDRGYYGGLLVRYYDDFVSCISQTLIVTETYLQPIDFELYCPGSQAPVYEGCELHPDLNGGEKWTADWQGLLLVPTAGLYTFTLANLDNDGRLVIAGEEIIDHWCAGQAPNTGQVTLTAGLHNIRVEFGQYNATKASLTVKWQGPDFTEEVIPLVWPFPDDQCNCGSSNCELAGCSGLNCTGQPINTFDGQHTYAVEDLRVPAAGRELAFARTYAAQDITATVLGYGWTHNWAMRLLFSEDAGGEDWTTVVVAPDGARLRFFEHYSGTAVTYSPYPGVHGNLVRLGSTPNYTYVLTGTAQTAWTFDQDGVLREIHDTEGRATTLSYTTTVTCTNVLDRVTGPDGDSDAGNDRYLALDYDDDCRVVEVRDHGDRFVAFGYDQAGDLAVVTDTRGFTWTYTYSGSHLLYEVRDPNGHLLEKTAYDEEGRAVQQCVGEQSTPVLELDFGAGLTRVVTDARGISQTVTYNARNTWAGTLDAAGNPITRTYDANFNLDYVVDANGNPTAIAWNACGCRPTQITDALDGETTMTYDDRNNLETYTDAGDHTTSYYYAEGTSLLVSTTNELGLTTYYTYSRHDVSRVIV